ncbi:hypothetical protein ONA91_21340 [Micromonospora sp. DR5-3]|uniref:hypothetical protein n=1 Tax=unclassified Micromonospora TaxID=2617518 RepID=UPI0011D342E4|nr:MULTISPECIES: hypothetical protein [unclassified Micromonospora]MCW3816995.1 hypothetical protein [Micromonospora sp. DR5-3]TYC21708.1 hypothetical protein FXF52_24380 [Micromonospora sp. MP36]
MATRRLVAVLGVVAVLLAGCVRARAHVEPGPLDPRWQPLTLPVPRGTPGRLVLRDVVACAGRWFVVGGVADPAGETRPAAWASADGLSWSSVPIASASFYGARHVLYAAACRQGRLGALGARNGGVHGNPRTGTWVQDPDGALREVVAPFELYGGPRAVSVSRLVAGSGGWLVVGSRADGAAVWTSPDGERFTLREGVPELAGDGRGRTVGLDAVAVPAGWLVVGAVLPPHATTASPLAWTSVDGRVWRRVGLPASDGRSQAQRVALVRGAVVAVGPVRDGFGVWRAASPDAAAWRRVGGFGAAGPGVSAVRGLVSAPGGGLLAVTGDGSGHGLWFSVDSGGSWRPMALPVVVPDGGDSAVAAAFGEDRLMLVADDGVRSRAWWASVPVADR